MDDPWDALQLATADEDGGNATPSQMVNMLKMHKCPAIVTEARKWTYSCMSHEICCNTGCCIKEYRKITQFWYGWFMLTIIGAFLLACLHYYKKQRLRELHVQQLAYRRHTARLQQQHIFDERVTNAAASSSPPPPHGHSLFADEPNSSYVNFLRQYNRPQTLPPPQHPPLGDGGGVDAVADQREAIMDRYLAARAQQQERAAAPPPSYEELMRDKHAEEEEPPPVYLEACKLIAADSGLVQEVDLRLEDVEVRDFSATESVEDD